jgi:diguanylate cyclase (GGDEF)-like protein
MWRSAIPRRKHPGDTALGVSVSLAGVFVAGLAWGIAASERLAARDRVILFGLLAGAAATMAASIVIARRGLVIQRGVEDALRDLSVRDALTGLYNRRELSTVLARAIAIRPAGGARLALVMADIDHFKSINDLYGHATGDTILKWIANRLRGGVRVGDVVARFGGEEFALVLRNTDAAGAYELAERLRVAIASRAFPHAAAGVGTTQIPITLSFGIAEIDGAVDSAVGLIERADRALYEAKTRGRNRTEIYQIVAA